MSMEQFLYTMCKRGLKINGSPFKIYSYSEGLEKNFVFDIAKRVCNYKEPDNLPFPPTKEEIENHYPVSYSYSEIISDTYTVNNITYCDNYLEPERGGNYISHVIVTDKLYDHYPIEFYESNFFKKKFGEDEFNSKKVAQILPVIQNVSLGEEITWESVWTFINADRIDILKRLISAVIEREYTCKRIILLDEYENIPIWIAAIQMSFPVKLAHKISFITYTYSPQNTEFTICGVNDIGTDYNREQIKEDINYYLFDIINRDIPDINTDNFYAKHIEKYYVDFASELKKFHSFMDYFSYNTINNEINYVCLLFTLFDKNSEVEYIIENHLKEALDFAEKYASDDLLNVLVNKIISKRDTYVKKLNYDIAIVLLRFLISISIKLKNDIFTEISNEFIYESIHKFVVEYGKQAEEKTKEFLEQIAVIDKEFGGNARAYIYSSSMLERLLSWLNGNRNIFDNMFYLKMLIECLRDYNQLLEELFENPVVKEVFSQILNNIKSMPEFSFKESMTTIVSMMIDNCKNATYMMIYIQDEILTNDQDLLSGMWSAYYEVAKNKERDWLDSAYEFLIEKHYTDRAYELFLEVFNNSEYKQGCFWEHCEKFLSVKEEYTEYAMKKALDFYVNEIIKSLDGDEYSDEYIDVVERAILSSGDKEYIRNLIETFESALPLTKPKEKVKDFIYRLVDYKKDLDLITIPDKPYLLKVGLALIDIKKKKEQGYISNDIIDFDLDVSNLSKMQMVEYLDWVLPVFIYLARNEKDHEMILNIFKDNYAGNLNELYAIEIKKLSLKEKENLDDVILSYIKHIVIQRSRGEFNPVVLNEVNVIIEDMFHDMSDGRMNSLNERVAAEEIFDTAEYEFWSSVVNAVRERRDKSVFGKLKNIFRMGK
jgi:hypothetical protein